MASSDRSIEKMGLHSLWLIIIPTKRLADFGDCKMFRSN